LLENEDEAVSCRHGDVQVEMVVSTVQARLSVKDAVVIDYGAGVGRVLAGLATANNFKTASYVAVDEPVPREVKELAGRIGMRSDFVDSRDKFLASGVTADVIMVVNTLHHVPFGDVARQLGALAEKLRPGGILLVHEMGVLRVPEQRNVGWRLEDLMLLFHGAEFTCNPRSTLSRSGVPLAHVLVSATGAGAAGAALQRNVASVWRQMKTRALEEIRALYASGDPDRHAQLQHALITNANLDLNPPPGV
jgi:SAM-dependent methyltransferase